MPRGSRRVAQTLELALALLLLHLLRLELMILQHSLVDHALLAHDFHLAHADLNHAGQVADLLEQIVRLANLVGRLLEPALGGIYAPVAVLNVAADVALIVEVEAPRQFLRFRGRVVFLFKRGQVGFWALAEVLLGVCKEVVRARACEVGAADLGRMLAGAWAECR